MRRVKLKFKKFLIFLFLIFSVFSCIKFFVYKSNAEDSIEELQKQIDELEKLKKMSEDATKPLEQEVKNLNKRIESAKQYEEKTKFELERLEKDIEKRENEVVLRFVIFKNRVANQYKQSLTFTPLVILFSQSDAKNLSRNLTYSITMQAQDNQIINSLTKELVSLEEDKKKLEKDKQRFKKLQIKLAGQIEFFNHEINSAKQYQQELANKIAQLTAKQKAILAARSGNFTTSVGDVSLADDFNASIAFKPQAPSDSFAVFSFGAYTHRKGMSQYGAKARAEAGQNVEQILKAYFPNAHIEKNYNEMSSIIVDGYGTMSFEDRYLLGIYEMPESWPLEALKAQAIAARTYAIASTSNGQRSICTTEACQVFKNAPKTGNWKKAVEETKHWVLVDDSGNPVTTYYASTHGGYVTNIGFDIDGAYSDDWASRAWEKKANSPWFYKAWYREGYLKTGNSCGRSHPWLSQKEFSDIINAWIVRKYGGSDVDMSRILPITINSCNIGGQGGNPYSMDELKDLANKYFKAVEYVKSVKTMHSMNGQTTYVVLDTNVGEIKIPGNEFKDTFNIRAPGYIRIPQTGFAFFNIEHKL